VSAEIYEIRIWRGYVKAQLYAVAGSDKRIATSRYFKLARTEVPTADALSALSELRAELTSRPRSRVLRRRPNNDPFGSSAPEET
jgi:hypothetical protein